MNNKAFIKEPTIVVVHNCRFIRQEEKKCIFYKCVCVCMCVCVCVCV